MAIKALDARAGHGDYALARRARRKNRTRRARRKNRTRRARSSRSPLRFPPSKAGWRGAPPLTRPPPRGGARSAGGSTPCGSLLSPSSSARRRRTSFARSCARWRPSRRANGLCWRAGWETATSGDGRPTLAEIGTELRCSKQAVKYLLGNIAAKAPEMLALFPGMRQTLRPEQRARADAPEEPRQGFLDLEYGEVK